MQIFFSLLMLILPWRFRRAILRSCFGYEISPRASVGYSLILAKKVVLGPNSRIGHLTVVRGLDELSLGTNSRLGNLNWVSGYPSTGSSDPRRSILTIEENAAITHRHLLDCADRITIGKFSTVAGWNSQFITHSIELDISRQTSEPIRIGDYCFIGSRATVLKGTNLPNNCVLAAGAVLTRKFSEDYCIYGGVPAMKVGKLSDALEYFHRRVGYVT
jgi:carbonic anhydrase/acetyltransferase-like protein (isoleucine patch superfamily)